MDAVQQLQVGDLLTVNRQVVAMHTSSVDGWIILDGMVYDMSGYNASHPGGDVIIAHFGQDATAAFHAQKSHGIVKGLIKEILDKRFVGYIECDLDSPVGVHSELAVG